MGCFQEYLLFVKLNSSIQTTELSIPGYLSLIQNGRIVDMHGFGVYVGKDTVSVSPYMCFCISLLISPIYPFFLYLSFSSRQWYLLERFSHLTNNAISIYSSANYFVFIDYNVYHVKWLHHSSTTDLTHIQTANISTAQILTQIHFPTRSGRHTTFIEHFIT